MEPHALEFPVDEDAIGQRVDTVLAELAGVSRAQVRRWIDAGRVRVGGDPVRASRKLALGETIAAEPLEPVRMEVVPEPIPLVVLHEDEDVVVIENECTDQLRQKLRIDEDPACDQSSSEKILPNRPLALCDIRRIMQ